LEIIVPKILPDIQNRILAIAENHFKDFGFEKTDMRQIATEAEIAIGTIYIHFQNKEELYLQVIERHWRNTIEKIETISNQEADHKQLLSLILQQLVQDMTDRKSVNSLWMEVGTIHHQKGFDLAENKHFSIKHDQISQTISKILKKIAGNKPGCIQSDVLDQLGNFAFVMVVDVCMLEPVTAASRIDLIADLLITFIEKSGPSQ
jgi:AcrR family transcriptional regulator